MLLLCVEASDGVILEVHPEYGCTIISVTLMGVDTAMLHFLLIGFDHSWQIFAVVTQRMGTAVDHST